MDTDKTEGQEPFDPREETSGRDECVSELISDVVAMICEEPCSTEAETSQGMSKRQKENCQNKPTAERSTVVENGRRAHGLVECKATGAHRPGRASDDSMDESEGEDGSASRSLAPRLERRRPAVSPA
jgi:hypothetical protein